MAELTIHRVTKVRVAVEATKNGKTRWLQIYIEGEYGNDSVTMFAAEGATLIGDGMVLAFEDTREGS